jgi:hypothetical protein
MTRLAVVAFSLLVAAVPLQAQALQGVWKLVETVESSGPDAGRHTQVQPGLLTFTGRHYSLLYVRIYTPRTILAATPTDADKARAFDEITAQTGTYSVKDTTLSYTPIVAKNPTTMTGRSFSSTVRVRGDSLWLSSRPPSGGNQLTTTWVRIEQLPGR